MCLEFEKESMQWFSFSEGFARELLVVDADLELVFKRC